MRIVSAIRVFLALVLETSVSACSASSTPVGWKTDCAGRVQISLQEEADVATITVKSLEAAGNSAAEPQFFFPNGQLAAFSHADYFGSVHATAPLTKADMSTLRARVDAVRNSVDKHAPVRVRQGLPAPRAVSTHPFDGAAWNFGDGFDARLFVNNQYFGWAVGMSKEENHLMHKTYNALIAGLSARRNFEIPKAQGVCFPYAFVRDDGTTQRHVATTYQLRSHPEVTRGSRKADRLNAERTDDDEVQTYRSVDSKLEGNGWKTSVTQVYSICKPEEPGDGTVPHRSGVAPQKSPFVKSVLQIKAEHEPVYLASMLACRFTLRAVVQIAREVQKTTLAYPK